MEVECDATPTLLSALKGRPTEAGPAIAKAQSRTSSSATTDANKRRTDVGVPGGKDRKDKRVKTEESSAPTAGATATAAAAGPAAGATAAAGAAAGSMAGSDSTPAAASSEPEEPLDVNPIPESDVLQLRGHTAEVRWRRAGARAHARPRGHG